MTAIKESELHRRATTKNGKIKFYFMMIGKKTKKKKGVLRGSLDRCICPSPKKKKKKILV